MKRICICLFLMLLIIQSSYAGIYYVSITGNNTTGDGSSAKPWKTLQFAVIKVAPNQGHTIQLGSGTFIENGLVQVPLGVSVTGAGKTLTIIKAVSSFYYYPATPSYAADKFLLSLTSSTQSNGNQTLSNFTIDGDLKKLHGGIYVNKRNNVTIDNVNIKNTNFTGIWLWDVNDSKLKNTQLTNCSWGSIAYCAGALNLGNLNRVEIDHLTVDESTGYGIKAIGPSGNTNILNLKIHDSHISVHPLGLWNSGTAPNIAIELWQVTLVGCEIYNSYVDNTISLINSNATPSTGIQTIRVHHNTIDMMTRAQGAGYGVELTVHDAEIDHNYFIKGNYGIVNWDHPMQNWSIHHNTFYALQGIYPGEVVRSQSTGLHKVKLYNNTIEFASDKTMNVVGMYGGSSDNVDIKNNVFIDNNTAYNYYPNSLVHLENGATLNTLTVKNNSFTKLPIGSVPGTYSGNLTADPQITKLGNRPDPYYTLKAGSPLINAGLNVGYAYTGTAPDVGAYESSSTNASPGVTITSPVNNASFNTGTSVTITANATDSDGSITKVEFYNGSTKLGEDLTSPFSLVWNATAGTCVITAKATDNVGATVVSSPVTLLVGSSGIVQLGLDSSDATLTGQLTIGTDAQAQLGSYFYVPAGNGKNYYIPPPAEAVFNFQLPQAGSYAIWAKVKSPSSSNQGYYIYDGKGKWFTWLAGIHTPWTWVKITDGSGSTLFSFNQGANQFHMSWYDENVPVDQIIVTNNLSFTPTADPVVTELSVYPNPMTTQFTIQYNSSVSQLAQVSVFSLEQILIKQTIVTLQAGPNDIPVTTENIYNGMYIVNFKPSTGQPASTRIIVNK